MLSPYNILYPHLSNMVSGDDYIISAKESLDYLETIITANYLLTKKKKVNIVAFIVDIDANYFKIEDISGKNISSSLIEVFIGTTWVAKDFGDSIPKTDSSYTTGKIFVRMTSSGDNIGRNIFESKECDMYVLSLSSIKKFEYLLNGLTGVVISGDSNETVLSIDIPSLTIVTNVKTYVVKHTDIISTINVGDIIQRFTMLDKVMSAEAIDGYIKIKIKPGYEHFSELVKSDVNVITEIGSI